MRAHFGGQPILVERNGAYGRPLKGYTFTAWDAETGGNQYTDLEQGGVAVSAFTTSAGDRTLPDGIYGPPDVDSLWLDSGDGTRELVRGTFTAAGLSATYASKPNNGARAVGQGELFVNAKDHGATGDGTTDDAAAINAALTAAAGGTCHLPKGTYNVGTTGLTLPSSTRLVGAGANTVIKSGSAANLLNANFAGNQRIESLTLDLSNSGNQAIRLAGSYGSTIRGVQIINGGAGIGIGIISGSSHTVIEAVRVTGCNYGIVINNGSTDTRVSDCVFLSGASTLSYVGHIYVPNGVRATFVNCVVASAAGHGAWIGGATTSDVTMIGCTFRSCGTAGNDHRGVTVDSSCARVKFIGCDFEANQECGAYVSGTPTEVDFLGCVTRGNNLSFRPGGHGIEHLGIRGRIANCRSMGTLGDAANEGCGFYVGGSGTAVVGCDADSNHSAGIRAVNTKNTLIEANRCRNNSQRGASLHDGIEVTGLSLGATENVTIIGNRCWDDQATKTQRFGINASSANVDYYIVTGNNTRGNASTGFNDAGGANKAVANNL